MGREQQCALIERTRPKSVVIAGLAGVGKTRLAREVLPDAEWIRATKASAAIPFGAMSHLLPDDARDRTDVLRRIAEHLERDLVVDDAHLLDDASAAAVFHLVTRGETFALLTTRANEPCPDAITALWKDGHAERIELGPLSEVDTGRILDTFDIDAASKHRLVQMSAGNPLLLRELVTARALVRKQGVWRWNGVKATPRLTEVIATRLNADEDQRRLLEVVACAEPVSTETLERLARTNDIAEAERKGLIHTTNGQTRLGHPLYGEVLRETMPPARLREICGALADTDQRDVLRAGLWRLQSGRPADPRLMVEAARHAMDRFDLALAERFARAANGGWEADHVLAEILSHSGRYEESLQALPHAPTKDDERVRWAVTRSDVLYWGLGDPQAATDVLDTVEDPATAASKAWVLLFDGRCEEAVAAALPVLRTTNPQALCWAAAAAAAAAGFTGNPSQAREIHAIGLRTARAHRDDVPWGYVQVGFGYGLGLLAQGRLNEAWDLADREYRAAARQQADAPLGAWAGLRGATAKARGDLGTAVTSLRESLILLAGFDTFRLAAPCLAELAGAYALQGRAKQAERLIVMADREASRLFTTSIRLNQAWTQATRDTRRAARTARAAADQEQLRPLKAWALYDAFRLGDHSVRGQLEELADDPVRHAFALAAGKDPRAAHLFQEQGMFRHAEELGRKTLLTPRERDIAKLATRNLTSRQIAAELGLSVRTVDNALGRTYLKLGIHNRADLEAALQA